MLLYSIYKYSHSHAPAACRGPGRRGLCSSSPSPSPRHSGGGGWSTPGEAPGSPPRAPPRPLAPVRGPALGRPPLAGPACVGAQREHTIVAQAAADGPHLPRRACKRGSTTLTSTSGCMDRVFAAEYVTQARRPGAGMLKRNNAT